jgi:hypothetical protein
MNGKLTDEEIAKIRRPAIVDVDPYLGDNKKAVKGFIESFEVEVTKIRTIMGQYARDNDALAKRVDFSKDETKQCVDYIQELADVIQDVPLLLTSLTNGEVIEETRMKIRRPVILDGDDYLGGHKKEIVRYIESFDVAISELRTQLLELATLRTGTAEDQMKFLIQEGNSQRVEIVALQNELLPLRDLYAELKTYANVITKAMFTATHQLTIIMDDEEIPADIKTIPRPNKPASGSKLEQQNTGLIGILAEFDTGILALQTRLESNKTLSGQMNAEIQRQKGALDAATGEVQKLKDGLQKALNPSPKPLVVLADAAPVAVPAPAPLQAVVVSPNADVKALQDRIAYLEAGILEKNSDLLALERQLANQADRIAALGSTPVSPRSTHTPDAVQLFQLLERLHKLVGPDFPHVLTEEEKNEFIDKCCIFFVHAIPQNSKREFILAIDKDADIRAHLDYQLYTSVYQYLMGTKPRERRGEWYGTEEDAVVEEVPTTLPFDTTLPSLDRSEHRRGILEKDSPRNKDTRMPIVQLLTDLKTMHACM